MIRWGVVAAWAVTWLLVRSAAAAPAPPTFAELGAALDAVGGGELVLFDPPPGNRVLLAARVKAGADVVRAVLLDPAAYRRALPELIRADVVEQRLVPPRSAPERLLAWELEVPLWNFEGRLWLRPWGDGVLLELQDGHFAPGRFFFTVHDEGAGCLVALSGTVTARNANFVTRQLAKRNALAEPAMTVTAAWALLRAMVLDVESGGHGDLRRRPVNAPSPPSQLNEIRGQVLAAALGSLAQAGPAAVVTSRPDGRLDSVAMAVSLAGAPAVVAGHLGDPKRWQSLPGWKEIDELPPTPGEPTRRWEVDAKFPFVDFDATWRVQTGSMFRAQAVDGDTEGALLSWSLAPHGAGATTAVFVAYPRIEKTGYFPRKLVAAEPLLEQALSLSLVYVNAVSLSGALVAP